MLRGLMGARDSVGSPSRDRAAGRRRRWAQPSAGTRPRRNRRSTDVNEFPLVEAMVLLPCSTTPQRFRTPALSDGLRTLDWSGSSKVCDASTLAVQEHTACGYLAETHLGAVGRTTARSTVPSERTAFRFRRRTCEGGGVVLPVDLGERASAQRCTGGLGILVLPVDTGFGTEAVGRDAQTGAGEPGRACRQFASYRFRVTRPLRACSGTSKSSRRGAADTCGSGGA